MVKKSLLWLYRTLFITVSVLLIIISVIVLGLRYVVIPHIEDYKDQLAQKLSSALHQKVTIAQMSTSWNGINLQLSLHGVDIYDAENRPALTLEHIETNLSWLSIPLMEPHLASLVIYEPMLIIRREKSGVLYVAGIAMGGASKPEFANWALRQSEISIVDAKILWQDDLRDAPPLTFNRMNVTISNPAWEMLRSHHYFGLKAIPSAGSSYPIDVRGDVFGSDVDDIKSWHGTIYSKVEGTDIAAWRPWVDYPFNLRQGFGAAQAWLTFANNKATSVISDVILNNVKTQLSETSQEATLNTLTGRLEWIQHTDGQEIQAKHIKMTTSDGLNLKNGEFSLRNQLIKGSTWQTGYVKLDEMNLADLRTFANYYPAAQAYMEKLTAISPVGKLNNIEATWHGNQAKPQQYTLQSQFSDLGTTAYQDVPGISHVSGDIKANETSGSINIRMQKTTLDMQAVMRQPIPIDQLSAQINWKNTQGKPSEIHINNFAIANPHLAGTLSASYLNNGKKGGFLELSGKFGQADAKNIYYYYPKVMGDNTVHWLTNAIQAGKLENINVTIKGSLEDFPFTNSKSGIFRVTAEVKDGVLDYGVGWPKIEDMDLDMLFEGKSMELNAKAGHMFGNQITKTKAIIPDLTNPDPMLNLTGETQGLVSEGIKFINSSPLNKIMRGFTDDLRTTGNGKLTLEMHMPLEHTDDTKLKGSYVVNNGSMASDSIPELSKLNGKIDFTESVLNAQNINTWLYAGPAIFSVTTNPDHTIRISARGHLADAGLKQAFPDLYTQYLSGSSDWYCTISILDKQSDMTIRSDLVGMASSLPSPLKKSASETMTLVINRKKTGSDQEVTRVNLGNMIGAKYLTLHQNKQSKIDRGEITFNTNPELPAQTGLALRGNLETIDYDDWLEVVSKPSTSTDGGTGIVLNKIDLSTNTLDAFNRRLNTVKINAKANSSNDWDLVIQSQEISGNIQWQHANNGKVIAQLKNLTMPLPKPSNSNNVEDTAKNSATSYPELDITADNFEINQKKLGHLELQAKEQNDNWSIQKLKLASPDNTLTATGDWFNWKRNPNTLMNFQWSISDLGKTVARLGSPDTIKGGEGEVTGQLKWSGSPHEFDLAKLSGNFQLETKNGQFLKIQPGVGRLFSVLSLQNLPRRLTLDFKDVFNSGFAFDKVSATVNINRGVMKSDNFKLEGPTARVEIHGETDLQKTTQHLFVKVTPYISDSLSLAAFAGGPAVGAAAYIAQKILQDPLNKLAEDEYEIVGTWDNPREIDDSETKPQK